MHRRHSSTRPLPLALAAAALASLLVAGAAQAADSLVGHEYHAGKAGQPVCETAADLQALLGAMIRNDDKFLASVTTCDLVAPGTTLTVLEDLPAAVEALHALKVKTTAPGKYASPGKYAQGYAPLKGLQP